MLSQPFLKLREFDGAWLLQGPRREAAHPVVVDAKSRRYGSVLSHLAFNILPGFFNSLIDGHLGVDTIVVPLLL